MTTRDGPAATRTDWLLGTGASRADRRIVTGVSLLAAGALTGVYVADLGGLRSSGWAVWHVALAIVLAVDVVGGVAANATNAAKRLYHGPLPTDAGPFGRLVHRHPWFAALHVHPIAVGVLVPGGVWWWGLLWYLWALGGVLLVRRVATPQQRPLAFAATALGIVVATAVPAPTGFGWFPAVLLLKLVAAHAVDETGGAPVEPPAAAPATAGGDERTSAGLPVVTAHVPGPFDEVRPS